jgi:hypothetical protein
VARARGTKAVTAAFVRRHAAQLSGVTWREAAKYIPAADRAAVEAIRARGAGGIRRVSGER